MMKKLFQSLFVLLATVTFTVSCSNDDDSIKPSAKTSALILDCDPGTDDALALKLLAAEGNTPDWCVSTFGNMPWNYVQKNTNILVRAYGLSSTVAVGATMPYDGHTVTCGDFHGKDGLANQADSLMKALGMTEADTLSSKTYEDLAQYILSKDSVTYIAIGPLTTLSHIIMDYPETVSHIKRVLIMGGGIDEFNKDGDKEYNFAGDGISVYHVFCSDLKNIVLFPLDLTNHYASISTEDIPTFNYSKMPWLRKLLETNAASNKKYNKLNYAVIHDATPCMYLSTPSIFTVQDIKLSANLEGAIKRDNEGVTVHVALKTPTAHDLRDRIKAAIEK